MTVTKFPRTSQPQGAVGIDWNNPLSRGLIGAWGVGYQGFPSRLSRSASVLAPVKEGVAITNPTSVAGVDVPNLGTGRSEFTVFSLVNSASSSGFIWLDGGGVNISLNGTQVVFDKRNVVNIATTAFGVITLGTTYAVAVTYSSPVGKIFVNGTSRASGSNAQTFNFNTTTIGGFGTHKVLAPLVWNRALSDAEIKSLSDNPWAIFAPIARNIWVPTAAVVSISRPTADVTTSGWTGNPDNTTLFNNIDETVASDTDYITSPTITGGENAIFTISPTLAAGTWDVRFRAQFVGASAQVRIHLLDGSNVSQGVSSWQTVTSTFALYTASVTTTGSAVRVKIEVQ